MIQCFWKIATAWPRGLSAGLYMPSGGLKIWNSPEPREIMSESGGVECWGEVDKKYDWIDKKNRGNCRQRHSSSVLEVWCHLWRYHSMPQWQQHPSEWHGRKTQNLECQHGGGILEFWQSRIVYWMIDHRDMRRVGVLEDVDIKNRDCEVLWQGREERDWERMQVE